MIVNFLIFEKKERRVKINLNRENYFYTRFYLEEQIYEIIKKIQVVKRRIKKTNKRKDKQLLKTLIKCKRSMAITLTNIKSKRIEIMQTFIN